VAGELTVEAATKLAAERIRAGIRVHEALLEPAVLAALAAAAEQITAALRDGRKLLIFGNGGSAADAQHIAAEFVGRFLLQRRALPAIALTANSSVLTAVANDYSFGDVFARQVEGLGDPGDVALGISTSGTSGNVVAALRTARERGLRTLALTGPGGGTMAEVSDVCVRVPAEETPRIQEGQLVVAHVLCELVERDVVAAERS
jgi:D-sedoheptulose 7-phosphate isomerase